MRTCLQLNRQRGRRGQHLVIPVDWEVSGNYEWELSDDGQSILVTAKYHKLTVAWPCPKGKKDYLIEKSYSEVNAVLRQRGGDFQQPLYVLFAAHTEENMSFFVPIRHTSYPFDFPKSAFLFKLVSNLDFYITLGRQKILNSL